MTDFETFKASLNADAPPARLSGPTAALWYAGRGDWHEAHAIVMDDEGTDAAWIHAYLHRVEGDLANAGYWYRRAARPVSDQSLDEEWESITRHFLRR